MNVLGKNKISNGDEYYVNVLLLIYIYVLKENCIADFELAMTASRARMFSVTCTLCDPSV